MGFSVRKTDDKFVNAVDDFQRYRDKKAWELAFRSLTSVTGVDPKLMAPSKDGFMLPARQRIMELLVSLPPDGREAYRLFNDAPAKQMYEQATATASTSPADEVPMLRKLYEQYFITSIGDQAADRLGDALFESGDFLGADAAWAAVTEKYPDSDLSATKIQVKRGVAMARSKRYDALATLVQQMKEKDAGATVSVGGSDVVAVEFLSSLVEPTTQPSKNQPALASNDQSPINLPPSDQPAWQCQFLDNEVTQKIAERVNGWGWQGASMQMAFFVPSSDTDGKRVYVNWLGACFAIDAASGKMAWRTDKFDEISQKVDQLVQAGPDVFAYSTVVIPNDRVLFVRVPVKRINYDEPMRLTCHDANTGSQKWSSESGTLSSYAFLGKPVFVNDIIYAPAKTREGSELMLLTIDPSNGKMISSMSIGQAAAGTNYRGNTVIPSAQLSYHQGKVFILTNNGGVVCVSPATKQVEWAFQCEGPPVVNQQDWWQRQYGSQKLKTPGVIAIRDGILYFKERGVDDMYALDLSGPTLKWKRPIDESDMIAGITSDRILTVGSDAGAIDRNSKALTWSTRIPLDNGMIDPLLDGHSLFVYLSRGVYEIDASNGKLVRIFRGSDKDSMGGSVWRAGSKLITVSNQAVTAYPLSASARAN
jgi:outer membrane protein assembly factor BamB